MVEFECLSDWKYLLILIGSVCTGIIIEVMFSVWLGADKIIGIVSVLIGMILFFLISIKWDKP